MRRIACWLLGHKWLGWMMGVLTNRFEFGELRICQRCGKHEERHSPWG